MGLWEICAEEMDKLEKEKRQLKEISNDREIGIISGAEVLSRIDQIDRKLGNK